MKKILTIIVIIAIAGFCFFIKPYDEKILNNSILKDKAYSPNVVEVFEPKSEISFYLFEDNTNPIVAINATFIGAGLAQDSVANFVAATIADNKQLQEDLEINGISLSFSPSLDGFDINILTPKKSMAKAIEIFIKAFYNPSIEQSSINKTKEQLKMALKRQLEHPQSVLGLEFNKAIYGNHPYSKNPLGTEESINKTTKNDILNYLKTAFAKDNLVVSIAGDISADEANVVVDMMFKKLNEMTTIKPIKEATFNKVDGFINHNSAQNISIYATPATFRLSPDFYPLYIVNYILGGSGLNSKLAQVIREENGLVYSIYSYLAINDKSNMVIFGFSTSKDNYKKAHNLFENEIKNLKISKKDLENAKNTLIATNNLRFAKISDIARFLTYMQKENLGLDFLQKRNNYIKNVNQIQIDYVINKYLNFNNFNKMSIGEQ